MTLRALIVAYAFPPVGGAGVQRVTKLVKYLPAHGVEPSVLTVANPSVPVTDLSLLRDLPRDLEIVRARTLEPGYGLKSAAWSATAADRETRPTLRRRVVRALSGFAKAALVPDPQVLWAPAAALALGERLVRRRDDVVFVSGPPFSQFVLAPLVSAARRLGVVLDYRDEWSTLRTSYEMGKGLTPRVVGEALEPALLRCAHRITTATPEFRDELLRRFAFLDPANVITIPNGYDRDDVPTDGPTASGDRLRVTYAGTVFHLTSMRGLLGAIRLLHQRDPELAKRLDVRFLGRIVDTEREHFAGTEALGVRTLGYVPHDQVMPALLESDLGLCVLDDVAGADRIYPAKIFELMALGRPVLTLAPEGALARLVRAHRLGEIIHPRDEVAIAESLGRRLRILRDQGRAGASDPPPIGVERFDRKALAGEMAEVLRDAARASRGQQ